MERVRKSSAVLASLSLVALALTGCTAAPTFDGAACDRAGASQDIAESVTVKGEFGKKPDAEVFTPVRASKTAYTDLTVGDGRTVEDVTQPMIIDLAFYGGSSGEQLFETAFDGGRGADQIHSTDFWAQRSPGLKKVLGCVTAGTRTLAVLTPEDFGPQNVQAFGLEKDETIVAIIDVREVLLPHAEGALQFNDAQGLPTVVRAADGTPGVIIPDSAPPQKPVVQTLIKGDGATVGKDDAVVTHVMAVGWDDKQVVNSTWGAEPGVGAAAAELVGATVGSQLLLVMPASEQAPATAIVVDILGAAPAATQ